MYVLFIFSDKKKKSKVCNFVVELFYYVLIKVVSL